MFEFEGELFVPYSGQITVKIQNLTLLSIPMYSRVLNKRRGTLIKFLTNFQPLCPYSIPYVY